MSHNRQSLEEDPMATESTFAEFWPEYVRAHSDAATRAMHFVGTLSGWTLLAIALAKWDWRWFLAALIVPYALAWISHFFIEHNKPASFGHPFYSWWADQKMVAMMLMGKMSEEVKRAQADASAN
jgi:hypothetical protein